MTRLTALITEPSATSDEIESIARARMESARIDVLLDHPFFAAALLRIPMRGTSDRAIAVALLTDGTRIIYRYDLIAALTRPEVCRLLLHALTHVLLRHPERGAGRKWRLWTAACDLAVDELFETLGIDDSPRSPLGRAEQDLSAEALYTTLVEGSAALRKSWIPARPPNDAMLPPPSTLHTPPQRNAFDRLMHESDAPHALEVEGMALAFRTDLKNAQPRWGTTPGDGNNEIDAATRQQVDWQSVLARFLRMPMHTEWSFTRPNRKHLWRGLYLPGPVRIDGGRFVIAIDTSGSMSDRCLSMILGEIDAIRRSCACELTVLQFDTTIHATAEYSQCNDSDETLGSTKAMRMYGRGGTDIRLPFTWAEKERQNGRHVSALIVCTDGFGPLPKAPPADLPVLFLLSPQHQQPSFGQHLVLHNDAFTRASM